MRNPPDGSVLASPYSSRITSGVHSGGTAPTLAPATPSPDSSTTLPAIAPPRPRIKSARIAPALRIAQTLRGRSEAPFAGCHAAEDESPLRVGLGVGSALELDATERLREGLDEGDAPAADGMPRAVHQPPFDPRSGVED